MISYLLTFLLGVFIGGLIWNKQLRTKSKEQLTKWGKFLQQIEWRK